MEKAIFLEVYLNGDYRLQFGPDGEKSPVTLSNCIGRRFALSQLRTQHYTMVESIELVASELFRPTGVRNLCISDHLGKDVVSAHSDANGNYSIYYVAGSLFPEEILWEKSAVKECEFNNLPPAIQKLFYTFTANAEVRNEMIEDLVKAEISAFNEMSRFGAPKLDSPAREIMQPKYELTRRMAQVLHLPH